MAPGRWGRVCADDQTSPDHHLPIMEKVEAGIEPDSRRATMEPMDEQDGRNLAVVLVVEDDPSIADLLDMYLRQAAGRASSSSCPAWSPQTSRSEMGVAPTMASAGVATALRTDTRATKPSPTVATLVR